MEYCVWLTMFADTEEDSSIHISTLMINGHVDPTAKILHSDEMFQDWSPSNRANFILEERKILDNNECMGDHYKVVSNRLKEFLEERVSGDAEFLPIILKSKKSGKEYDGFHLLHVLKSFDCINLEKTAHHPLDEERSIILREGPTILDKSRITDGIKMFRLKRTNDVMIALDIALELKSQGFTGLRFAKTRYE